jgi:hypothetical protein
VTYGVLLVSSATLVLAALIVGTAVGSHRRGRGTLTSFVSGLVFPVTWVAWYVVDERPNR